MASCPDPLPHIVFFSQDEPVQASAAPTSVAPASPAADDSEEAADAAILDGLDGGKSEGSESSQKDLTIVAPWNRYGRKGAFFENVKTFGLKLFDLKLFSFQI